MSYETYEASVDAGSPYFLYLFDKGGTIEISDAAIYFALDVSGSMAGSRLSNLKMAIIGTLAELKSHATGPIDIHMVAWAATVASSIERRSIDAAGYDDLVAWVNGLTVSGGTNFNAGVSEATDFFAGSGTMRRLVFFITDGEPEPASSASAAAATLAAIANREVFCFNIDLADTTYTAMLDNTPQDGVPVASGGYSQVLKDGLEIAFLTGIAQKRLTSEPNDIEKMGETWTASPVMHGDIEQTGNIEKNAPDLTFPLSDAFARTFLLPSAEITTVTIWRGHREDPAEEHRVVWKGRVLGAKDRDNKIIVSVESIFTSMRRPGCRARFQRTCRHALYHSGCNLSRAAFELPATITAVDGLVLTIPEADAAPDGDYAAGIVNFGGLMGFVSRHVGTQVTLLTAIAGLADEVTTNGSAAVLLAPGCNLTRARCNARFNNGLNFGGFDRMPDNNPFSISIV